MKRLSEQQSEGAAFRTFEDLEVYKKARQFRKDMYGVGKRLPQFEKYELGSQIRRASLSLTNNIAEGHGRYHYLDQIKFQLQARGSLAELVDDLNVCEDEAYLPIEDVTGSQRSRERSTATDQWLHSLSSGSKIRCIAIDPRNTWRKQIGRRPRRTL